MTAYRRRPVVVEAIQWWRRLVDACVGLLVAWVGLLCWAALTKSGPGVLSSFIGFVVTFGLGSIGSWRLEAWLDER